MTQNTLFGNTESKPASEKSQYPVKRGFSAAEYTRAKPANIIPQRTHHPMKPNTMRMHVYDLFIVLLCNALTGELYHSIIDHRNRVQCGQLVATLMGANCLPLVEGTDYERQVEIGFHLVDEMSRIKIKKESVDLQGDEDEAVLYVESLDGVLYSMEHEGEDALNVLKRVAHVVDALGSLDPEAGWEIM